MWGMGTVWQRGNRWWIRWREDGKRKSKSFGSEDLARKVLAQILEDIARGKPSQPAEEPKEAPTLAELAKPWLKRRERTHRAWDDDRSRWNLHLEPHFGKLRPAEVDAGRIRRFIEAKLAEGLAASTCGHCIRLLSTFFSDVIESGHVTANPVASLPRSTRRLYPSTYDTCSTPFIEKMDDIRRVFLALGEPFDVAFACGVFLGLRTAEVMGLRWQDIDMQGRRVHVSQQIQSGEARPLKDAEPRTVPLMDSIVPILGSWKLKTGGKGLLFKPADPTAGGRPDIGSPPTYIRPETMRKHLTKALKTCGLPALTWYQATRHTFASQFVLNGGSIEVLRQVMGHSSVVVTERYSHLKPDLFRESVYTTMSVDLSVPAGTVVLMAAAGE